MTPATSSKILYVDDDSDDCYFLKLSLSEAETKAELVCAQSGEEAIHYLNSIDTSSLPSLIVLDLNMPKLDGRKVLRYIKREPRFTNIPVAILSTSENKKDQEACSFLGACSYFKKPFHLDGYREIIRKFMLLF